METTKKKKGIAFKPPVSGALPKNSLSLSEKKRWEYAEKVTNYAMKVFKNGNDRGKIHWGIFQVKVNDWAEEFFGNVR